VPISARIFLIVAVIAASGLGLGAVAVWSLDEVRGAFTHLRSQEERLAAFGQLERRLLRAEYATAAVVALPYADEQTALARTLQKALDDTDRAARRLREAVSEDADLSGLDRALADVVARRRELAAQALNGIAGPVAADGLPHTDGFGRLAESLDDAARALSREHATIATAAQATVRSRIVVIAAAVGAILVLAAILALFAAQRAIVRPIVIARDGLVALSEGGAGPTLDDSSRKDEVGELLRAALVLEAELAQARKAVAERPTADDAADGNRDTDIAARIEADIAEAVNALAQAARQLGTSARNLTGLASGGGNRTDRATQSAEETNTSVQAVASAAEELAASAREIGSRVSQSTAIASAALHQAEEATAVASGLSQSAGKIGEVVVLIDEIAHQTNLLALNATIEAARAGAAGKGFAVVATEVKALAEQTGNATKEISVQIGAVQQDVKRVVAAIDELKTSFVRANELATSVATAVEQQSAATSEIAQSIQRAATSAQDVSVSIVDISKTANDTGRGASELADAAGELNRQTDSLRDRLTSFISSVTPRAA